MYDPDALHGGETISVVLVGASGRCTCFVDHLIRLGPPCCRAVNIVTASTVHNYGLSKAHLCPQRCVVDFRCFGDFFFKDDGWLVD